MALVQHIDGGNGIGRPSRSLSCSVLGDIYMSPVLQQLGDPASRYARRESRCAGSFHSAFSGFNGKWVNDEVDSVTDYSNIEKPVSEKKQKSKKSKKNKKKSKSTKEVSDKIVSGTGQSKNDVNDAKPFYQSSKAEIDSSTSLCALHVNTRSKDPTNTCCKGSNINKQGPEVVRANCSTEDSSENTMPCKSDEGNSCHAISESNGFKCSDLASQVDAVNKSRHHPQVSMGKQKSHLVWKKSQKSGREAGIHEAKRLDCNYMENDVDLHHKNFFGKHSSVSSKGLLPSPLVNSSRHIDAARGIKHEGNKEIKTNARISSKVFDESSRWAAKQKSNGSLDDYASQSSQVAAYESMDCEQLKSKSTQSKSHNNCRSKKGQECHGESISRLHNNFCFPRKGSLQVPFELNYYKNSDVAQSTYNSQHTVTHDSCYLHPSSASSAYVQPNMPCLTKFTVPIQGGFQPYSGTNRVLGRSFHACTDNEPYMRFKQFNEHTFRKDVTSGMNAKKWIPVGTKEPRMLDKTDPANICYVNNGNLPLLCEGVNDSHPEGNIIHHQASAMLNECSSTSLSGNHKMNAVESEVPKSETVNTTKEVQNVECGEVRAAYAQKLKDTQQLSIGSQMIAESLSAACKMQSVSEGVELLTGCPLADFERLLHSAAPVIASSYAYKKCDVCLDDQLSHSSLCKHQIPNTSLCDVWKWYEESGNYGLKVKAGNLQNPMGMLTKSTSFDAYFVPSISAVQLFSYSHLSNFHGTSEGCHNPEMQDNEEAELCFSSPTTLVVRDSIKALGEKHFWADDSVADFDSDEEPVISSKVFPIDGDHFESFTSSPAYSSNYELAFEFFESEKPPQRKPLHHKIVDLIDAGTSKHQVFGDPSKLVSLKLHDLHPASWFSVAWYPIYRIPEGNLRASFLTYHSLGHLVQRHVPTGSLRKKTFCVVSPVIGMQSYNTQGECWFDLRIPVESSLKVSPPFNSSEVLRERLRTLEGNASFLARGCVYKDEIKVFNQQPDYEFFSSRRH